MIQFNPTELEDQSQILNWTTVDPYHEVLSGYSGPGWWVTGSDCLLAARIDDEVGPTMYFRLDHIKDNLIRMHVQFAPENQVNRHRVVKAILNAMPALIIKAKQEGARGFIFESVSPLLIRFMEKFGFKVHPEIKDDYVLFFGRDDENNN
jgi:hypothetical protein